MNQVLHGDCLELMKDIESNSIDLILCDLPYGTTQNKWDIVIPFEKLWEQYERIIKINGAIVLTAAQPFTTDLINSNRKLFKYDIIWYKALGTGFLNANKMPMRNHEHILVFYDKLPTYNPIMRFGKMREKGNKGSRTTSNYGEFKPTSKINDEYFPQSVVDVTNGDKTKESEHPTQKPVKLFQYLIETYTNTGDIVLDNCAGSGTTAIACIKSKRKYIVMEREFKYVEIIRRRIIESQHQISLF